MYSFTFAVVDIFFFMFSLVFSWGSSHFIHILNDMTWHAILITIFREHLHSLFYFNLKTVFFLGKAENTRRVGFHSLPFSSIILAPEWCRYFWNKRKDVVCYGLASFLAKENEVRKNCEYCDVVLMMMGWKWLQGISNITIFPSIQFLAPFHIFVMIPVNT